MLVLYLGVVSHWVSVVVHRDGANMQMYLLDSSNFVHLNQPVASVPQIVIDKVRENNALGVKSSSDFENKMFMHSLCDQRNFTRKLSHVLKGQLTLT